MYGCMNSMSTIYNPTNRKNKLFPINTVPRSIHFALCHAPVV